jgi:hypothetical protein
VQILSAKERAVAAHKAREELYFYSRWMMHRRTGQKWLRGRHHPIVADALTRVFNGQCKRLIINEPPRYSKTQQVTDFVSWALGKVPDAEFIYTSYSGTLAEKNSWQTRDIVASEAYHEIFPGTTLRHDAMARGDWRTQQGGCVYAAGAGGTITGFGAGKIGRSSFGGALIIDDPHKADEAHSETIREGVIEWFQNTLESRLNSPDTPVILIMQRLHELDLAGWLLEGHNGEKWELVCLPAIQTDGTALWPEKHSIETLKRMQDASPYIFSGQYQQLPRPPGGAFFTEHSLLVNGQPVELPERVDGIFATVDTAAKSGKDHDGLAVVYGAMCRTGVAHPLTILDWDYTQLDGALLEIWLPTVFQRLEELAQQCKARMGNLGVWIEDKAAGIVLLQQGANRDWNVHAIDSKLTSMGKVERGINISGYVHAGHVKVARPAYERVVTYKGSTKNHFMSQVLGFSPGIKDMGADDVFDAWCYNCALALGNSAGF